MEWHFVSANKQEADICLISQFLDMMLPTFKRFKSTGEIRDTETGTTSVHATSTGVSCHSPKCFNLGHSLRSPSKTFWQSHNACIHLQNSFPHFHKPSLSRPIEPCWSTVISVNYFVLSIFAWFLWCVPQRQKTSPSSVQDKSFPHIPLRLQ